MLRKTCIWRDQWDREGTLRGIWGEAEKCWVGFKKQVLVRIAKCPREVRVIHALSVWLFATLWTVAHQAPLFMGFSRQDPGSGLPFPSPGNLPDPNWPRVSWTSYIGRQILYHCTTWEAKMNIPSNLSYKWRKWDLNRIIKFAIWSWASLLAQKVKEPAWNAGDLGLIPGSGRSPGGGHGNPLQYSCLENPMDRGAWWATVHGVTKS